MVSSQCVSIGVLQYFSADQNICHLVALHGYGFSLYIYMLWYSTILWFHINMSHWLLRYVFSSVCFQWCFTRFFYGEKTIVLLAAQIWFLRSVYPVVLYQLLIPSKSFFTFTAVIWFLPSVFHVVLCQFLLLCKTFVTLATDI